MAFITGANGLLGSHLALVLLQNGEEVTALKRKSSDLSYMQKTFEAYSSNSHELFDKINWIDGDILDFHFIDEVISNHKEVYHTAAMVSFNPEDHKKMLQVNIEGTSQIVNSCIKHKSKLVYCSSIAALGRGKGTKATTENDFRDSTFKSSVYSRSKFEAEQEVWRGIAEGLDAAIVNPSVILGPGDWSKSSCQLFKTVADGLKFYTNGTNGYVDARDVANIMFKLMKSDITAERFVVSAENISYKTLFTYIAESLNLKSPSLLANKFLSELSWRLLKMISLVTRKKPLITKETAQSANSHYYYSSEKVIKTLDYSFIPIKDSINTIGKIYLENNSGK
jgi:nucleoside-diphosphate-sugar epimerase